MKRKLLFIIALFALPICGRAQFQATILDATSLLGQADFQIVRTWPTTHYALAYSASRHLCLIDYSYFLDSTLTPSFPARMISLPDSLASISDISITGDTAYFCGVNLVGVPVVGLLNLNKFFSPLPLMYLYTRNIDSLASLTKIKTIPGDAGGAHVYALGTGVDDSSYLCSAILELRNFPSDTNYKYVKMGASFPFHHEWVDDIAITNSHIVFVSRDNYNLSTTHISMRYVRKTYGLADNHLKRLYYFPVEDEYNGPICATALSQDSFAIAYPHIEDTLFTTRYRKMNIGLDMSNIQSQEYAVQEKSFASVVDIASLYNGNILPVLQPWSSNNPTAVVPLIATSSLFFHNYSARCSYTATPYLSMDTISNSQLILAGANKIILQSPAFQTASVAQPCFSTAMKPVKLITNLSVSGMTKNINVISDSFIGNLASRFAFKSNGSLNSTCIVHFLPGVVY